MMNLRTVRDLKVSNLWQLVWISFKKQSKKKTCFSPCTCVVCVLSVPWERQDNVSDKIMCFSSSFAFCHKTVSFFVCNYGRQMKWTRNLFTSVQYSLITCFHSSAGFSLLIDSVDIAWDMSFSDLKWNMDCLLLLISIWSTTLPLSRSEKSCSERLWKLSRVPRGLGYMREVRRW